VKMDRPNSAFATFLAVCFGALVLLGLAACCLLAIVAYRVQRDGFSALTVGGNDVRPALGFLAVLTASALAGLWSLRKQSIATRRLRQRIEELRLAPSSGLIGAADLVGVAGRVDLIDTAETVSFTYGLVDPRVAVSRGLLASLSDGELEAVLEHELYHVHQRDPLKVFVVRLLAPALFFLPVLRELRSRYVAGRELAADRRVLHRQGQRSLAGALYKVVGSPAWVQLTPAAAIGGGEALEARVHQLETGETPNAPRFSRIAIVASAGGALTLLGAFFVSTFAFGGPAALARLCGGS
jgi:Zn-dependent protease with chaperone function